MRNKIELIQALLDEFVRFRNAIASASDALGKAVEWNHWCDMAHPKPKTHRRRK